MSEQAQVQTRHDAHDESHPAPWEYIKVAIILAVITIVEVWIVYVDQLRTVLVPLLVGLSAAKFFLVVLWFMHLKFDSKLFSRLFYAGLVLALALFLIVLAVFGIFGG